MALLSGLLLAADCLQVVPARLRPPLAGRRTEAKKVLPAENSAVQAGNAEEDIEFTYFCTGPLWPKRLRRKPLR